LRAIEFDGERPAVVSRDIPNPRPGELLLRLRVSGLCGTDLFKLEQKSIRRGIVLGHEIAGVVEETGRDTGFDIGDRVVVPHHVACGECLLCLRGSETLCPVFREDLLDPGGFAEYVIVKARATAQAARKIPDQLSDEAAMFLEPAACVLRGINRSGLRLFTNHFPAVALIVGGGSMGLLHLLVLKALDPAMRVIVSDPIEDRRKLARILKADAVAEPGVATSDGVRQLSSGYGADVAFDTVGGTSILGASLESTREGGTVVLFAHAPQGERATFEINPFFKYERRLFGTYSGSVKEQAEIFGLLESGALDPRPLISHRLPLEEFARGVELARMQKALKVVFVMGDVRA